MCARLIGMVAPWTLSVPVFMASIGVLSVKLGFGKYARFGERLS
jgi:hypothetical protein